MIRRHADAGEVLHDSDSRVPDRDAVSKSAWARSSVVDATDLAADASSRMTDGAQPGSGDVDPWQRSAALQQARQQVERALEPDSSPPRPIQAARSTETGYSAGGDLVELPKHGVGHAIHKLAASTVVTVEILSLAADFSQTVGNALQAGGLTNPLSDRSVTEMVERQEDQERAYVIERDYEAKKRMNSNEGRSTEA